MALWGRIHVNNVAVGDWTARRLTRLTTTVDEHSYEWEVEMTSAALGGTVKTEGILTHRYSDGPVALAAKIMQAAAEQGVGAL